MDAPVLRQGVALPAGAKSEGTMTFRSMALVGAATMALISPALADEPGWYLGLGAGYDHLNQIHIRNNSTLGNSFVKQNDGALIIANVGYKFDWGLRSEVELGYDWHDTSHPAPVISGGESVSTALFNLVYDVPLGDYWSLSLGGGAGVADVNAYWRCTGPVKCLQGADTAFAWQGIAGISYALADDVDLFADYRYRSVLANHNFASFNGGAHTDHVSELNEHVALVGLRWYLAQPAPPPPPEAPPAPPPPPPPPPVKTFIVFFDFDKSNLTAEGQSVVSEAVKTAKQSGFVKVMVTGHTDTVGSDTYNQALSVRRAQTVKEEMVREGMDEASISIEGKSFHDPLVATGPGVREPQNRRAVIDLGG
jgi:OOP family OmpA-OmpF porin